MPSNPQPPTSLGKAAVEAVVLAAGLSTRSGRWKMGLPLGDSTVLQRCLASMREAVHRIWIVTGWQAHQVAAMLRDDPKVELVHNSAYRQGMFSSVQAGLACVRADRAFLTPGDYALIPSSVYAEMLSIDGEIVIPTHSGRKGHPVLLSRAAMDEILALPADAILRDYIAEKGFVRLEVDAPGILLDIDTPQDYETIREMATRG